MFVSFAEREFGPLTGLAYALCGDRLAAPEIAQEALLVAYAKWERVCQMERPEAWVRRVVANRATSLVRRRVAEATALLRLRSRRELVPMHEPGIDAEWLWAMVRALPRRQRQVVALRFVDRLTLDEIADTLRISKASAATHMRRALEALATRIDKEDIG